jgi:cytochrome P450
VSDPGTQTAAATPNIVSDTEAFLADPNGALGCPRARMAKSHYGVELLSYDLVRNAFMDPRMTPRTLAYFKERGASPLIMEFLEQGNLNFTTPERHDRIRGVMGKAFTRTRIEAFRPKMRQIATSQLRAVLDAGECDLVADLCHLYPISVFAQFMGAPEADVPLFANATVQLRMLGQVPFEPGIPALEGALNLLRDYIVGLIAERRAQPKDDFIDALIALQAAGEKISEKELIWGVVFLMLGGHDTTRYTLSNILHSLIDQGQWDAVAIYTPEQLIEVVNEGMRYRPGTPRQIRVVAQALELEGHALQPGDVVSLNLAAAGRDPEAFTEPETFQCGRSDPAYLVGFGVGRHNCIGQLLARIEMAEAVGAATRMLGEVELTGPGRVKPTGVIAGYDSLPIRFIPREA